MQNTSFSTRDNISDAVSAELRRMIVDGRLPEGERVNEVHLAHRLGVSRTPLREALAGLVHEGALRSLPRIGYFVAALTAEEFEQLYAIRPLLDGEALRLSGVPSADRLIELEDINRRMAEVVDVETAIGLDDAFHHLLLAGCGNRVLLELIDTMIWRTRRYELALMRETNNVLRATDEHERILKALRGGDMDGACVALKDNLQSARIPVLAWLATRKDKNP